MKSLEFILPTSVHTTLPALKDLPALLLESSTVRLVFTVVVISLVASVYSVLVSKSKKHVYRNEKLKTPPTYPYTVPFVGHVLAMAWDSNAYLNAVMNQFKNMPVRLNLLFMDMYVISGSEIVDSFFKESQVHNKAYKALAVHNMFNMPKDTLKFWLSDNSGIALAPHPDSHVLPHLRIDYHTFTTVTKFLTGPGLNPFVNRFTAYLEEQLERKSETYTEWTVVPDFFTLVREEFLEAVLQALCGSYLLTINPTFVRDFWKFHHQIPNLAKGYPRWLRPKPYRLRDKCLASIKHWNKFILGHLDDPITGPGHWSPYYGADLIRFRHEGYVKMPQMTADAAATEDLGMIWAGNGNSIPAAFWMIADIIRDPALFATVRTIVESCRANSSSDKLSFDWDRLFNDSLVQSIYAETLRLRVAVFLMRSPDHRDLNLKGWRIPTNSPVMVSSYHAQMDREAWGTSEDQQSHPIEEFWAERFLEPTESGPKYTLDGRAGHWLPYGGGIRMCPGRFFAKQEMISGLAILITMFDIEMVNTDGKLPRSDMQGVGFGTMSPDRDMPVRMRKRSWQQ